MNKNRFIIENKVNIPKVCINKNCFEVELAQDDEKIKKGLMNVQHLDKKKGMLFIFKEDGINGFWMKNVKIPLDIIWIDNNKNIVYIINNAPICSNGKCDSYIPDVNSRYVLEINGGIAQKIGLKIGDKADFKFN